MTPERWAELRAPFSLAVAAGADRAAEVLREVCGGDAALFRDVDRLVKEHFLQEAGEGVSAKPFEPPVPVLDPLRFRFVRPIGSGTFGDVYEVYDQKCGSTVALKILREPDSPALLDFKNEFRSLAAVKHDNLVRLHELICDGSRWMFTMELIEGQRFLDFIRNGPEGGGPVSAADRELRVRRTLPQLAAALNALHVRELVHRDLKPANVMVCRTGRVAVLDFGLVRGFGEGAATLKTLAGTPDYMSPEQANLKTLTKSSDWYAVGVMLYQALTGRLPFRGGLLELLQRKESDTPALPHQLDRDCSPDLSNLAVGLLSHDPTERLRYAALAGSIHPASRAAAVPEATTAPKRVFVGRDHELNLLKQAYARATGGSPTAVHISGPSGVGKSLLLREFLSELRAVDPSVLVFAGNCYEGESVPYQGLDDLVDSITRHLRRLPAEEVEQLLPRNFRLIVRMFPVLGQVCARETRTAPPVDSGELRSRAFTALCEMLGRIAERQRVVLVIDDLQWGDLDSGAFFRELIESAEAPPLLLLIAYRSEDLEAVPWLKELRAAKISPGRGARTEILELAGLSREETVRLARALAGPTSHIDDNAMERVVEQSGGDPFLIHEIIRWISLGHTSSAEFQIETLLKSRCDELAPAARMLLELVAVAGQPLELAVLKARFDAADRARARDTLLAARLLRWRNVEGREEVEVYHDRIRAAVVAGLGEDELRERHRALAMMLAGSGNADPERLASHFQQAGEAGEAAAHAKAAAERAVDTFAFNKAARFYRLALENGDGNDAERLSLCRKLGDALSSAGRGFEAASAYLDAAARATGLERRRLLTLAASQQLRSGYSSAGGELMAQVLEEIGIRSPKGRTVQLLWVGLLRMMIKLHGLGFRERTTGEMSADELFRIDLCATAAVGYSMRDPLRSIEFSSRFVLLALKAGEPYRVALALAGEATQICHTRSPKYAQAWELIRRAETIAKRIENVHAQAFVMLMSGIVAYFGGQWRRACDLAEAAAELLRSRCHGVHWELSTALLFSFVARGASGRWRESRRILPTVIRDAEARGDLYAQLNVRILGCAYVLDLAAGEPEKALADLLRDLAAWSSEQEYDLQRAAGMHGKIDIALYQDTAGAGWNHLLREWPQLEKSKLLRLPTTFVFSYSARGRLSLAMAEKAPVNERAKFIRFARDSAQAILASAPAWGRGLAHLLLAGVASFEAGPEEISRRLAIAEQSLGQADLAPFRMGALYRHALLQPDPRSTPQWKEFEAWVSAEEVARPDRIAAVLAPGHWHELS